MKKLLITIGFLLLIPLVAYGGFWDVLRNVFGNAEVRFGAPTRLMEYQGGTGTSTYVTGDILYSNATNQLYSLPIGSTGQVLKVSGGIPSWDTDNTGGGGGGSGLWASTSNYTLIYPIDVDSDSAYDETVIVGANATTSGGYRFEVVGDSLFDGIQTSGDIEASANGGTTAAPRVFGFNNLSSNEAVRFQFGDEHNAFQNAYANDVQIYSYWGLVLTGGRQNYNTGFNPPSFQKTLDYGVLVKSDTPSTGNDGGSSGNPITTLGVMATTSQTADLTRWVDADDNVLAMVNSSGGFIINSSSTITDDFSIGTTSTQLFVDAGGDLQMGTITAGTWNGTVIADAYITKTGAWTGTFDGFEGTQLVPWASASTTYPNWTYASSTYVHAADWTTIDDYPTACTGGQYVSAIGDTLTCSAPSAGGSNWRFPAETTDNYITPTSTVGIIVSASSTIAGDFTVGSTSTQLFVDAGGNVQLGTITAGTWNATAIDFSTYTNATADTGIQFSDDAIGFDCSEVEGTGIDCTSEAITLDATGDWTGTLDGIDGSAFLQDITSATLGELKDVSTTTLAYGSILRWNGSSQWDSAATTTWDTNANTFCSGSTTYLDGEGNCDDISGVYVQASDWTTIDNYPAACGAGNYVSAIGDTLTCSVPSGGGGSNWKYSGPSTLTPTSTIGVYLNSSTTIESLLSVLATTTLSKGIEMQDDQRIWFDSASQKAIYYDSDIGDLVFPSDIFTIGGFTLAANTAEDGGGNAEPALELNADGTVILSNTTQGNAGKMYVKLSFTDGIWLNTGGDDAILLANAISGDKEFSFPNLTGTILMATGTQDILTTGCATSTSLSITDLGTCTLKTDASGNVYCGSDLTGSGGGGDSTYWATTSDNMVVYVQDMDGDTAYDEALLVGSNATTTVGGYKLEVVGDSLFDNFDVTNSTTSGYFVMGSNALIINSSGEVEKGTWNGTAIDFSDYTNATADTGIQFTDDAIGFDCSEVEGVGIDCATEAITLDATGDWTGTLDGYEGATLREFTTTTADYWFNNTAGVTGNANIVTVGTIGTGTWEGDAIGDGYLTKSGDWTGTLDGYEGSALLEFTTTTADHWFDNTAGITGNSNIVTVGTLTGGGTGAGFTVDLDNSTLTCTDCVDISDNTNLTAGDHITLTDDDLDIDDDFFLNAGDIISASSTILYLSAHHVTSTDRITIPSGAAPEVGTAGNIAIDTTSDTFRMYGSAQRVVPYWNEKCWTMASSTWQNITPSDIPMWSPFKAIEVTDIYCRVEGGTSVAVTCGDTSDNDFESITCDTDGQADDGSITNATFSANEGLECSIGAVTGTVNFLNYCITYIITAD